ncbi:MAG: DNA-binding protein [Sphingomonadales bacterium]|nr:MAG: DNA-binding protein [Sphingomonadales bacterium]TNF04786.1 MAG: DNA-binding protein [Sphingomonadales bacterium]
MKKNRPDNWPVFFCAPSRRQTRQNQATYAFLQKNSRFAFLIVVSETNKREVTTVSATAIADGLFRALPEPTLIGGRNRETGRIVFPCPADRDRWEAVDLPRRGTLWSWTVQRYRPKTPPYVGPEDFAPFALGYVELPGATIVESRLVDVNFDALKIGMEMQITLVPFATDDQGNTIMLYAFTPLQEG